MKPRKQKQTTKLPTHPTPDGDNNGTDTVMPTAQSDTVRTEELQYQDKLKKIRSILSEHDPNMKRADDIDLLDKVSTLLEKNPTILQTKDHPSVPSNPAIPDNNTTRTVSSRMPPKDFGTLERFNKFNIRPGTNRDDMILALLHIDNNVILNDERLLFYTGTTPERFELNVQKFKDWLENNNSPLIRSIQANSEQPGCRCKLEPRHMVLMLGMNRKRGYSEDDLANYFAVSQSTVSRHLLLADAALGDILPTPNKIEKKISGTKTKKELKKYLPGGAGGEFIVDGTHIKICRPIDKDARKSHYSGKKKTHTRNVNIFTNKDGLIVAISPSVSGSTHDKKLLDEYPPRFGKWLHHMNNPDLVDGQKFLLRTDLGFVGYGNEHPGIIHVHSYKRPRGKKGEKTTLDERQILYNKRVNKKRIIIEHAIGRMKKYLLISRVFVGTDEDLNRVMNTIGGFVNQQMMWPQIAQENKHLIDSLMENRRRLQAGHVHVPE